MVTSVREADPTCGRVIRVAFPVITCAALDWAVEC